MAAVRIFLHESSLHHIGGRIRSYRACSLAANLLKWPSPVCKNSPLNGLFDRRWKVNLQWLRVSSTSSRKNFNITRSKNDNHELQVQSHPTVGTVTTINNLLPIYLQISKIRLTGLIVLTAMGGYLLAPGETALWPLLSTSLSIGLSSCSANAINQWLEVPYDSQMARTRNRVLVRGLITPIHAAAFAAFTGAASVSLLYLTTNPLAAYLAALNIFLYTCVYTPSKRIGIVNTWLGSVVGALPPLMGWVAKTGSIDVSALVLAGILYSWQFPHFNALSWGLRADYSRAGYRMMAVTHPELCRRVALRHSAILTLLSCLLPICHITPWWFILYAMPTNLWFTWLAWRFHQDANNQSARRLFQFSLVYLPLLIGTMFISRLLHEDKDRILDENNNDSA